MMLVAGLSSFMLVVHSCSSNMIPVVLNIPQSSLMLMPNKKQLAKPAKVKLFASCFVMNQWLILCTISVGRISYYAERRIDKIPAN